MTHLQNQLFDLVWVGKGSIGERERLQLVFSKNLFLSALFVFPSSYLTFKFFLFHALNAEETTILFA